MKYLLIVRHAESSLNNYLKDFDRPLNDRGTTETKIMIDKLIDKNFIPDYIISSGAKRALSTTQIIAENIGYIKEKIEIDNMIYNSSIEDILNLIKNVPDDYNKVLITGHNPTFHFLSQELSSEKIIKFPTCSMFCISFNNKKWININRGKKVFMIFPELYK